MAKNYNNTSREFLLKGLPSFLTVHHVYISKIILFASLFILFLKPLSLFAQSGETCQTAINLETFSSPFDGTTIGAANDYTITCAENNAPDLFYYIEVPDGYILSIGQTDNDYDSLNTVMYGPDCNTTTRISCFDEDDLYQVNWQNTTGSTQKVYWVQDGYRNTSGNFTLAWTLSAPPSRNIPRNLVAQAFRNNNNANLNWTPPYKSEMPAGYEYAVTTSPIPPASGIYTTITSASGNQGIDLNSAYYLHVRTVCNIQDGYSAWASSRIQYLPQDCSTAINLATLTSPYSGTTTGAANNNTNSCVPNNAPDLLYYIEVPHTYILSIRQTASNYDSLNTLMYGSDCNNTGPIDCSDHDDVINMHWENLTGTSQKAYWIQDGYNASSGNFTLEWSLSTTSQCNVPLNVTAEVFNDGTANLNWTSPQTGNMSNGYEYEVTNSAIPSGQGTEVTGTSVNIPTLDPNIEYYAHIRTKCSNGSYSDWVTSAPFEFLQGDTCNDAIDLGTLESPYSFSTTGANDDFSGLCNTGAGSPDLFYYMEVPNGHTFTVNQPIANYAYSIYTGYGGDCPGENQIACIDYLNPQDVIWNNTTGQTQTVYLVMDGYANPGGRMLNLSSTNDYNGNFILSWTLVPTLLGTDIPKKGVGEIVVYKENKAININTGTSEMTKITIYDMRGRILYTETNINATRMSIEDIEVAQQVIILEINTVNGKTSKRIVF